MNSTAKILFLSDTHLGYDLPFRPRVERRWRGPDFFANFRAALRPAMEGHVDAVVHGGDLLYRSRVPARLVEMAFQPLFDAADLGIPVYLVPGNHERSTIPYRILAAHRNIHIFDSPGTFVLETGAGRIALAGFPYVREQVRGRFSIILEQTGWRKIKADFVLLCLHHLIDGAAVGPGNFVFRGQADAIRTTDIPPGISAVLAGHVHRHQVLTHMPDGLILNAPVIYAGSTEKTSFAEKDETKGFVVLEAGWNGGKAVVRWIFQPLSTRPMVQVDLDVKGLSPDDFNNNLMHLIKYLPLEGINKIKIHGHPNQACLALIGQASLRRITPPSMNLTVITVEHPLAGGQFEK